MHRKKNHTQPEQGRSKRLLSAIPKKAKVNIRDFSLIALGSFYFGGLATQALLQLGNAHNLPFRIDPVSVIRYNFTDSAGISIILLGICIVIKVILSLRQSGDMGTEDKAAGFRFSGRGTHGSAKGMTHDEIKKHLQVGYVEDAAGKILGKESEKENAANVISMPDEKAGNGHVLVLGGSNSGKSSCYIRPAAYQEVKAGNSIVVVDPFGELYQDLYPVLRARNYAIRIINFKPSSLKNSDGWDCLAELINDTANDRVTLAQEFTDVLMGASQSEAEQGKDDFWYKAEKSLCTALVMHVAFSKDFKGDRKIAAVYEMVQDNTVDDLDSKFLSPEKVTGIPLRNADPAIAAYKLFGGAKPAVKQDVRIGLGIRLQAFQSKALKQITSNDEIKLKEVGLRPTALFVAIPTYGNPFAYLTTLFFNFLFKDLSVVAESMGGQLPVRTTVLIDEAANIGCIPNLDGLLATVRHFNINISLVFQSIPQIHKVYSEETEKVFINNCDTAIFFGGGRLDTETSARISTSLGETTVVSDSSRYAKSKFMGSFTPMNYSETLSEAQRSLRTVEEVLAYKKENEHAAFVFLNGRSSLFVTKFHYKSHPFFQEQREEDIHMLEDHLPLWRARSMGITTNYEIDKAEEALRQKRLRNIKEKKEQYKNGAWEDSSDDIEERIAMLKDKMNAASGQEKKALNAEILLLTRELESCQPKKAPAAKDTPPSESAPSKNRPAQEGSAPAAEPEKPAPTSKPKTHKERAGASLLKHSRKPRKTSLVKKAAAACLGVIGYELVDQPQPEQSFLAPEQDPVIPQPPSYKEARPAQHSEPVSNEPSNPYMFSLNILSSADPVPSDAEDARLGSPPDALASCNLRPQSSDLDYEPKPPDKHADIEHCAQTPPTEEPKSSAEDREANLLDTQENPEDPLSQHEPEQDKEIDEGMCAARESQEEEQVYNLDDLPLQDPLGSASEEPPIFSSPDAFADQLRSIFNQEQIDSEEAAQGLPQSKRTDDPNPKREECVPQPAAVEEHTIQTADPEPQKNATSPNKNTAAPESAPLKKDQAAEEEAMLFEDSVHYTGTDEIESALNSMTFDFLDSDGEAEEYEADSVPKTTVQQNFLNN